MRRLRLIAPRARVAAASLVTTAMAVHVVPARAHDGPPFPIVSDSVAGPYRIALWADPDATVDGSLGGQFWIVIEPANGMVSLPSATRVEVSIVPIDPARPARPARPGGSARTGRAHPVAGNVGRQFVALLIDQEGRFAIRAAVEGPLGAGLVTGEVDATYDLRPAPWLIGVYLMPFVLMGALWLKLLLRRRRANRA